MENRRAILTILALFAAGMSSLISAPAGADELGPPGGVIGAEAAHGAGKAGEVTLIDIRTPHEWAQTGTPEGAQRLNLQSPTFGKTLIDLLKDPSQKPVALICATGRRSGYVMAQLRKLGLANRAYDVSEGMMGSAVGPGWIKRGLPLDKAR